MAGTWAGLALMPVQRAYSRAYLAVVLGRHPRLRDVWRHFFAFTDILHGQSPRGARRVDRCRLEPENAAAFEALVDSGRPALFGTFHFGGSDLLGYLLSERGRHSPSSVCTSAIPRTRACLAGGLPGGSPSLDQQSSQPAP